MTLSCQTLQVCCFSILKDERKGKKASTAGNFDDAHVVPQLLSTWLGFRSCTFLETFFIQSSTHLHRVSHTVRESFRLSLSDAIPDEKTKSYIQKNRIKYSPCHEGSSSVQLLASVSKAHHEHAYQSSLFEGWGRLFCEHFRWPVPAALQELQKLQQVY